MLDKHGFNLRSSLRVSQQGWHSTVVPNVVAQNALNSQHTDSNSNHQLDEDDEELIPQSLIEGEESDDDLFSDDEFST